MGYIDLHCDTLMQAFLAGQKNAVRLKKAMADLERLETGGCAAQFFAIFMPPMAYRARYGDAIPDDETYIRLLRGILQNTVEARPDRLAPAAGAADLERCRREGKIAAFLTLEDGRPVDGKLENLARFREMGVRLISLTWNEPNCLGWPNSRDAETMARGLTPFGRDAVEEMQRLGMLVDVSHLSDGGFWEVARLAKRPFLASHSNCRALCPYPRNLTDEMLRTLGEKGGVVGLNFGPQFLNADPEDRRSTAAAIARHARHMADKGGIDCVALGTDFDGITGEFEIGGPQNMALLADALHKAGFSEDQIGQIFFDNAARVIREGMN